MQQFYLLWTSAGNDITAPAPPPLTHTVTEIYKECFVYVSVCVQKHGHICVCHSFCDEQGLRHSLTCW